MPPLDPPELLDEELEDEEEDELELDEEDELLLTLPDEVETLPDEVETLPEEVETPPVEVETPPVDVDTPPVDVDTPPVVELVELLMPPVELLVEEMTTDPPPLPPPPPPKNPPMKPPPPKPPPPPITTGTAPPPPPDIIGISAIGIGAGRGMGAACVVTVTTCGAVATRTVLTTLRLTVRTASRFLGAAFMLLVLCTTAGRAFSATWTAPPPMIAPPHVQAHNFAKAIRTDIGSTLLSTPAPCAESSPTRGPTGPSYAYKTRKKGLTAIPLTLNIMFKSQEKLLFAESKWLTSHYETARGAGLNSGAGCRRAHGRGTALDDKHCHLLEKMAETMFRSVDCPLVSACGDGYEARTINIWAPGPFKRRGLTSRRARWHRS